MEGVHIIRAVRFWQRFCGLMLTSSLPPNQGLFFPGCNSVHTCFMRYPIDVVYLDRQSRVVKLVKALRPWRASMGGRGSVGTLELACGSIERLGLTLGQSLAQHPSLREGA